MTCTRNHSVRMHARVGAVLGNAACCVEDAYALVGRGSQLSQKSCGACTRVLFFVFVCMFLQILGMRRRVMIACVKT
jgi:hypothetical protein